MATTYKNKVRERETDEWGKSKIPTDDTRHDKSIVEPVYIIFLYNR